MVKSLRAGVQPASGRFRFQHAEILRVILWSGIPDLPACVRQVVGDKIYDSMKLHRVAGSTGKYDRQVYVLPKLLDEKVARLHLTKLGVNLTEMTQEQADYIDVPIEGPYKAEHYRY